MSETFTDYLDQSNQDQVPADNPTPSTDYTQGEQKGVNLIADAPDVRVEKLLTEARAANNAKQRYKDTQSYGIIEDDYVASQKHLEDLQNKIDQTQKMLDGTPPPRPAAGELNTGEQLAAAIALLASHGNPFATQQIMGASQKNADQRADQTNAYNQAVYEHHRATMLEQLRDMQAQHKAETQHGYDLKDLGLQHQARMEEIGAQGKNQQMQVQSKSLMMAGNRAEKTLGDETSSVEGRIDAMNMLETLYYETSGQMGRLFTPAEKQKNSDPNYHQSVMERKAATGEKRAQIQQESHFFRAITSSRSPQMRAYFAAQLRQQMPEQYGSMTDDQILGLATKTAQEEHLSALDTNIASEITARAFKNKWTAADTQRILLVTKQLPDELKYKGMHAQAAMISANNSGDTKAYQKASLEYAKVLEKSGKDFVGEWKSPEAQAEFEAAMKAAKPQKSQASAGVPSGYSNQEIIDRVNARIKAGTLTREQGAAILNKAGVAVK